jgi:hypothetical protein
VSRNCAASTDLSTAAAAAQALNDQQAVRSSIATMVESLAALLIRPDVSIDDQPDHSIYRAISQR